MYANLDKFREKIQKEKTRKSGSRDTKENEEIRARERKRGIYRGVKAVSCFIRFAEYRAITGVSKCETIII